MENASKALLIAGGILIALLITGLLLYMFGNMSDFFNANEKQLQTEQLAAFNAQFDSYNRKLLRGTDVISVMHKAKDINKRFSEEENYQVEIEFIIKEEFVYVPQKGTTQKTFKINKVYSMNEFSTIDADEETFNDFKRRVFDCVKVDYNQTTGRINYMKFEERKMTQEEYNQVF